MNLLRKLKIYCFPILGLMVPALLGIYWDLFNRYYRGTTTPFLMPALGLLLLSLFFWAKKRWFYFLLMGITVIYGVLFFRYALWENASPQSLVYYYRTWSMDTQTGLIELKNPIGAHPPSTGAYISCNFSLKIWKDYLKTQPMLCTAFDDRLRLKMFLHDSEGPRGWIREFQINYFSVDRKSLLGEPLDRWALRIAFIPVEQGLRPHYRIRTIYQVYEREIGTGDSKIVESFSRSAQGKLRSFTESPLLKFSKGDVYALYGPDGALVEIPRMKRKSFSFPSHIDVRHYERYDLPRYLTSHRSPTTLR